MDQFREEIPDRLFEEWMAFYALDPWGEERLEAAIGQVSANIANANRDPKKRAQPFRASDFLIDYESAALDETDERGPAAAERTLPTQAELAEKIKGLMASLRR